MTTKDFGLIEDEYLFFMQSTTEAECDRAAHLWSLRDRFAERDHVRFLDFGCGAGHFTQSLLAEWNYNPALLECSLVEPVVQHLHEAASRVSRFSDRKVQAYASIDDLLPDCCDFLLANHSCYYVECAVEVTRRLLASIRPGGTGILAVAGEDNFLIQMWQAGFASAGMSVPWWTAEDYLSILKKMSVHVDRKDVPYQIRFIDTRDNRMKLLRFLFADHLPDLDPSVLMQRLDSATCNGAVEISTSSQHLLMSF